VRAGILEERENDEDVVAAVLRDHRLGEEQKQTLLRVYRSFLHENDDGRGGALADAG